MKFSFQIQFDNESKNERDRLAAQLSQIIAEADKQVMHLGDHHGDEHFTTTVKTTKNRRFWDAISPRLDQLEVPMIVISASRSWSDYKLLRHFGSDEPLDDL